MDPIWTEVDTYASELFGLVDEPLAAALESSGASELPAIHVSECQGQMLRILVRAVKAKRVLEIGTLGGFSTIFLARGLDEAGEVVSLELDAKHAAIARDNLARAGLGDRVTVVEGDAHHTLARMIEEGAEPFDLIFVDAEKSGYPAYLEAIRRLSRSGTLIIADNVVRKGAVVDADTDDEHVAGARAFNADAAAAAELTATVVQTVGSKGHDGFLLALVE